MAPENAKLINKYQNICLNVFIYTECYTASDRNTQNKMLYSKTRQQHRPAFLQLHHFCKTISFFVFFVVVFFFFKKEKEEVIPQIVMLCLFVMVLIIFHFLKHYLLSGVTRWHRFFIM